MAPGVDWVTKSSVGPFIDTGVDLSTGGIIDRGRVYLSKDTIKEMAGQLGLFEELEAKLEDRYDAGYRDGIKETIGGDISRSVADLVELCGQLTAYVGGDELGAPERPELGAPDVSELELVGGKSVDSDSEDAGEGTKPRRGKRPAGVSAVAGDGTALRI